MLSCEFSTTTGSYSVEELLSLDPNCIPAHIAIIPDGNRRWAKENKLSSTQGHRAGADNLIKIVKAAKELGVKVVTFYSFSTENWSRDLFEVRSILWILESYLVEQTPFMLENGVRYNTIGDLSRFPKSVLKVIEQTKQATEHCSDIEMVMALNYGSRDEICRAVKAIIKDVADQKINQDQVDEAVISRYLDTSQWEDPGLLIRTSGERRLSNFLLWQTSYSEIYLPKVLWPDFSPQHFLEAILDFQQRERRLGG